MEVAPVREQVIKRVIVDTQAPERIVRVTGSGSVFDRLGGSAPAAGAATTTTTSTLTSGSALRNIVLTASAMPTAKATATVRPTTAAAAASGRAAPYSVKERLGGKGTAAAAREVVSSNLKLKSDSHPLPFSRPHVVSLKRSIFDRLGS